VKALFVLPNLAAGGVERQWSILVPGLRRRSIDARVLALDEGGPLELPLREQGVPVEVLKMRHRADLARLMRSRLARDFVPDVVVSQGVSALCFGELIAALRRAPHVHTDHWPVGLPLSPRREAIVRLLARRIDWLVAVSPAQTEAWLRRRVPNERIVVIANGVETPRVSASKAELRDELGVPDDAVLALLVATLRPEKRVADFVRAVVSARTSNRNLIGMIVGDGPERAAVEAAASGEPAIHFLGHRNDVPSLMKAADIFVLTSEYEALPMAILEALAAGLPVVTTSAGDVSSIVIHGVNGWLVPPSDTRAIASRLVELAAEPDARAAMGAAGRALHRSRWDAEEMIDRYAQLLVGRRGD
jgi:glycosyltransferase involved in cell wall biosynthesis